ncbi:MAG: (d)CMP kinase [Clostridia bacterium]|nr:(d)CMP kinase [Clostridia bacterium]
MIISIDGPASSGKSTVADILANKLGFVHFNSGALYRGIAVYLNEHSLTAQTATDDYISKLKLATRFVDGVQYVYVNDVDVTNKLRDNEISQLSSLVSANPISRKLVDDCQRNFVANNNAIIDGRDIGSVVFPNAEFKFYLDCSAHERAKRRFLEEQTKGSTITLEEVEQQILARDDFDKHKKISPLIVPNGAIIIDSTNLTIEEVVAVMIAKINK